MSTCSLTSAAAGISANTAHQAFLRAGCEQSHTMSPGGTCPPAAASLTGMPAKASRGRCLRGSRVTGWERKLVQTLPPQPLLTTPPGVLEDKAALLPRAPQWQLWQPAWEPARSLEGPQAGTAPSLARHLLLTRLVGARPPLPCEGRGSPPLTHARTPTVVSVPETPTAT